LVLQGCGRRRHDVRHDHALGYGEHTRRDARSARPTSRRCWAFREANTVFRVGSYSRVGDRHRPRPASGRPDVACGAAPGPAILPTDCALVAAPAYPIGGGLPMVADSPVAYVCGGRGIASVALPPMHSRDTCPAVRR
jgi:hypothetical protein